MQVKVENEIVNLNSPSTNVIHYTFIPLNNCDRVYSLDQPLKKNVNAKNYIFT
jgi:hypothetical protein